MSTLLSTIGKNVRRYRKGRRWTQANLADAVRCSQSTISGIESANLRPGLAILEKVAASLGIEPWKLFVEAAHRRELRRASPEIQELLLLTESSDPQLVSLARNLSRLVGDHLKLAKKTQRHRRRAL